MIVAVGSDKGSPGVTTLAVLLGLFWPGDRVVCELDPHGADLPFRLTGSDGRPLAGSPSVASLAVDVRPGGTSRPVGVYAQDTALGLRVVTGETSADRFTRLTPHLPALTAFTARSVETVITDLGCLQSTSPVLHVAGSASVLVMVTRADTESLAHLRDRVQALTAKLGVMAPGSPRIGVVVRTPYRGRDAATVRVRTVLSAAGSPVPVLGSVPEDPVAVRALWAARLSARVLRRPLFTAARQITAAVLTLSAHPAPELPTPEWGDLPDLPQPSTGTLR